MDAGKTANNVDTVKEAKSRLNLQEIIGVTNKGMEGLEIRKGKHYSSSSSKDKRDLIGKNSERE